MAHGAAWVMGCCLITTKMTTTKVGQQGSVDIANSYRLDDPQTESLWGGPRIYTPVQSSPQSHTASSNMDTGSPSRW